MKFVSLEAAVKRQIKASMKRIAQNLIKLNVEKIDRIEFATAFNIWKSRFISNSQGIIYYDNIVVDEELMSDLRYTMESIFLKETYKLPEQSIAPVTKATSQYIEKPATKKQLFYAKYLMDMVKNEPLPMKPYTTREISLLINSLKREVKAI
jgi:hypothetical protein